jgi:SAM-dependent methyltransferase
MSEVAESPRTSAPVHGPRWSARAADWAELSAPISAPAWEAVAEATGIAKGTRVLDVACGSGEFCRLAAARGALVSGIDAAEGMIEIARRLVPGADLRVGPMESLPWDDDTLDVVTGFNAFQFAADMLAALAEAKRVARPGGQVAICNWGRPEANGLVAVMGALRDLQPPPPPGARQPDPPAIGEPGVLEGLALEAGLEPRGASEVNVPFEARDEETLLRALLAPGGVSHAIEHSGEGAVRKAISDASAPFRRPNGSYRIENTFRYLIARA